MELACKVEISLLPENEQERVQTLVECQLGSDNSSENDFDRYISLAKRIFNVTF